MPGGLPSLLLNFVATHLVAFCLLAFAAIGLQLSNTEQSEAVVPASPPTSGPPETSASSIADDVDTTDPTRSDAQQPPSAAISGSEAGPQAYQSPRMIGGSLPVYGERTPLPQAFVPDQRQPFRPPEPGRFQPAPPPTRDGLVQQARRAFWNGDFEGAESAYMSVISAYPDDADAFGELGNLYQSMGKDARAMDAYFEAGVRLKDAGEHDKLQQIVDLFEKKGDQRIRQLAP